MIVASILSSLTKGKWKTIFYKNAPKKVFKKIRPLPTSGTFSEASST